MRKEKVVEETDPEYERVKQYIVELEDHLAESRFHLFFCQSLRFLETLIVYI